MKEETLYVSTVHNMKLGEFLTVNHTEKVVTYYQVTRKNLPGHSFNLTTIKNVMQNLNMFDQKGSKYTLRLLCFIEATIPNPKGIKFKYKKNMLSINDMKNIKIDGFNHLSSRISASIIRLVVFPKAKNNITLVNGTYDPFSVETLQQISLKRNI